MDSEMVDRKLRKKMEAVGMATATGRPQVASLHATMTRVKSKIDALSPTNNLKWSKK